MRSAALLSLAVLATAVAALGFRSAALQDAPPLATVARADSAPPEPPAPALPSDAFVWERPDGPLRVALQAGHWRASEAPDEQSGLRDNGTYGGGRAEWQVNLEIARKTAALLEAEGYPVEILPTTIPPGYWADLFISIHADGSPSPAASGYRAAAPRRDATGKAAEFVQLLERSYGEATGLPRYPTITRRMSSYYAFNYRRYDHALHPMTVGVILETGFLTSPRDRQVIVSAQDRAARGIASAALQYLEGLPLDPPPTIVRMPPAGGRVRGAR